MSHGLFRNRKVDAQRTFDRLIIGFVIALGLFALGMLLSGCAHDQGPPAAPQPRPKSPSPALCQPLEEEPDPRGGIVTPVTEDEKDLTARFLQGELDVRRWGRHGWERAAIAKRELCN